MRITRRTFVSIVVLATVSVLAALAYSLTRSKPADVGAMEREIAEIRGRPFKRPVSVRYVTREEALADLQALARAKDPLPAHYGKIVRMLGLYRGPEITDVDAMRMDLLAAVRGYGYAYYDADRATAFIERDASDPLLTAHELYHGFQDQHFDLGSYYSNRIADGSFSIDERMARRAVVEGEATYIQLWLKTKRAAGAAPTRAVLAPAVKWQSEQDMQTLEALLQWPDLAARDREVLRAYVDASRRTPAFLSELFQSAYRKGLGFVYAIHERGWGEIEKLYAEYPPASSEQILHPDKWFAREAPIRVRWPAFDGDPLFAGWESLDQNVLGELQLRFVFREHGMGDDAVAAAAGWGGDDYAIFRRNADDALLLLWHTTWDTDADAAEFAAAYRRLLAVKYAEAPTPTRVQESGRHVFVVEGGDEGSADAFLVFVTALTPPGEPSARANSSNPKRSGGLPGRLIFPSH